MIYLGYKLALMALALVVGAVVFVHRLWLRRQDHDLAGDLAQLARMSPGGTPQSAIDVLSSSVVEGRATSFPCHACGEASVKSVEHTAEVIDGERLRVVRVACASCGAERRVFLRVA